MGIFEYLVSERKKQKVTQSEMCESVGVNTTTLSRYENGKREIPFSVFEKYADRLGFEARLLKITVQTNDA